MVLWTILKKALLDFWEDMLHLIIFNVLWLVGVLLIIPYPFMTFGLFYTVYDIGQGKGIKMSTPFKYGKQTWKPAYVWGIINVVVLFLFWVNFRFYTGFEAQWAVVMQLFFIALTIFWVILQMIALAIYPRLVEPGFKLAVRNAAVIMARYPLVMLMLLVLIILLAVATAFFTAIAFVALFAFLAVLANSIVAVLLEKELDRMEE